jgi:transcription-repair coupling factor (superfamily II helicase)
MEHWLPLLEDRLVTIFDHLASSDLLIIDASASHSAEERLTDIADYYAARRDVPPRLRAPIVRLEPASLYRRRMNCPRGLPHGPPTAPNLFPSPMAAHVDFGFGNARDFAPERDGDNAMPPPRGTC